MVVCQLLSDIHLEFYDGRPGKSMSKIIDDIIEKSKGNSAKYLFLAGDIANNVKSLENFLTRCINEGEWEKIFYIPGNHEYYGKDKNLPIATLKYKYINIENVHCLHHNIIELPEMFVTGATLWTVPSAYMYDRMNDKKIRYNLCRLKRNQIVAMHNDDIAYINNTLNKHKENNSGKKIICMTHHAPSFSLTNDDIHSRDDNTGHYSNCDFLIEKSNYWLYGHTHTKKDVVLHGCRMINNPFGYPNEIVDKVVNFTFTIDN